MARGNHDGGKSLTERVRKAMSRAIKQGDAGIAGQRALSDLLAELMQNDVAKFIQITGPYIPKEILIDQTISISDALLEARNRVIDMGQAQVVLPDQSDSVPLLNQSQCDDAITVQQGGVQGGVGAENERV